MLVFWVGKRSEKAGSVLAIAKFPFFGDPEFPIEKKGYERQKREGCGKGRQFEYGLAFLNLNTNDRKR